MIKEILSNVGVFWTIYGPSICAIVANVIAVIKMINKAKAFESKNSKLENKIREQTECIQVLTAEVKELRQMVTHVRED